MVPAVVPAAGYALWFYVCFYGGVSTFSALRK